MATIGPIAPGLYRGYPEPPGKTAWLRPVPGTAQPPAIASPRGWPAPAPARDNRWRRYPVSCSSQRPGLESQAIPAGSVALSWRTRCRRRGRHGPSTAVAIVPAFAPAVVPVVAVATNPRAASRQPPGRWLRQPVTAAAAQRPETP